MKKLFFRFRLITTITGQPRVLFWWGVVFIVVACIWVWADFVPVVLSYVASFLCAGFGMFLIMQAIDLKRRQDGRR